MPVAPSPETPAALNGIQASDTDGSDMPLARVTMDERSINGASALPALFSFLILPLRSSIRHRLADFEAVSLIVLLSTDVHLLPPELARNLLLDANRLFNV